MSEPSPASGLRIGVCLPNFRIGATREGIDAAVETAARLGWHSVWSTDHVLPDSTPANQDYFTIFEALSTLAYAAGRTSLALGTSVLVAPMRNAAVVAKEVATIDALSGGRLTLGVGVGWGETEYANLGEAVVNNLTAVGIGRGRSLPSAGRLPGRVDRAVAAPLERVAGAVPRDVPLLRRLPFRSAAGPGS